MSKDEELKSRTEEVSLNREEIIFLETLYDQKEISGFKEFALDSMNQNELEFKGVKRRTKEELQNMMYTEKMAPKQLAGLIHIFNVLIIFLVNNREDEKINR